MINPFYSKTGGMQAEKCEQVKMVLTIVCGIYLIIVESLKGLKRLGFKIKCEKS